MDRFLDGLNTAQHAAVISPSPVLQILAPPGSGKTKTLTSRIAFLLSHCGYKPWNILCLTFTIKSAREMKERVAKLIGDGLEAKLILGTFHSICRRYLVSYGHLIGLRKGFGIADTSDSSSIIKRIIKRQRLNIDPKRVQSRISSTKSKGVRPRDLRQQVPKSSNLDQQEFYIVFEAYENQLENSNMLDYDDLLLKCVDLLRQHPECVSNIEVVMIDEFQDTNIVQFELMSLFATQQNRITTVGDPDQSIYGWRSAEIKNLVRMKTNYPDTLTIHLEDNYRSSGAIVLAAAEVIEQDNSRSPRPILPTHCLGSVPVLRRLPSPEIEAKWIVSEIVRIKGMTGQLLTYADFAILLRSAFLSRQIESAMGNAGIPYKMVGGQKFFDRVEIRILVDYLRAVGQPDNNDALARIINVPSRNIGLTTVKTLLEEAEVKNITFWALIRDAAQGVTKPKSKISKQADRSMGLFVKIIFTLRNKLLDPVNPYSPEDLLKLIIKKLDFRQYLERNYENDYEARWSNVEELLVQASEYSFSSNDQTHEEINEDLLPKIDGLDQILGNPAEETLSKFLANVALATELQRDEKTDNGEIVPQIQVTISTIHAAKGLEWPVVYIPSAYEGCIPHSRAEDTDEERRLLYVAMTRAQALLYISCPVRNSQREETKISPFLSSKKVCHYLVNKGPTLDLTTVADISRILGRECPSLKEITESYKSIQNRDDNQWTLNGEQVLENVQTRWDNTCESIMTGHKRRKLHDEDLDDRSSRFNQHELASKKRPALIGANSDLQDNLTFSYQEKSGFTTAAAQLSQIAKAKQITQITTGTRQKQNIYEDAESGHQQSDRGHVKSINAPECQGNLLRFWATSHPPKGISNDRGASRSPMKSVKCKSLTKNMNLLESGISSITACTTMTTLHESPLHSYSKEPLAVIPQGLADHKLLPIIAAGRPQPSLLEDKRTTKQYVFLSSSPPPFQESSEEYANTSGADPLQGSKIKFETAGSETRKGKNDVRPATTFHTTSIATAKADTTKRTLGVRRSMAGWTSRGNQPFSIPRKNNGR